MAFLDSLLNLEVTFSKILKFTAFLKKWKSMEVWGLRDLTAYGKYLIVNLINKQMNKKCLSYR